MLIKFFKHGQGAGEPPVNYLVAERVLAYDENRDLIRDENGQPQFKIRDPLPEVLKGNPEITTELINGNPHKWSYRAGVIAFANEDDPTEDQQREVMDEFERLAFAGLECNQYDILWVRHEHEGNVELHFCSPRLELTSGKSLNIAPPGYQQGFDALRDYLNKAHNWADPMELERRHEVKSAVEAPERAESREALHEWMQAQILSGNIQDRASMIEAFENIGFTINRQGKDYLSVKDRETDQKFRLKGEIYHAEWTRKQFTQRALVKADGERNESQRRLDQFSYEELRERFEDAIAKRASYHRERFANEFALGETADYALEPREGTYSSLADRLPDDRRDRPERLADGLDQQAKHHEPFREDGRLSQHQLGDAHCDHRPEAAFHHQLHALWERLLLPETEGGRVNVADTFGERVAKVCETAERSLRTVREYIEGEHPVLERVARIAHGVTKRFVDCLERLGERRNQLRDANDELIEGWTETDYRREQTERAIEKLEKELEWKHSRSNDYGLEL